MNTLAMSVFALPFSYLLWHYTRAWKDIWRVCTNYLWFFYHFFSIPLLLSTFLSPWKRISEGKGGGAVGGMLGRLIFNLMLRIVGILARTAVIGVGLFSLVLVVILFLAFLSFWLFAPLLLIVLAASGLKVLFLP